MRFSTLIGRYYLQLTSLSKRLLRCAPVALVAAVPTGVISQVAMILSFMLPLKIIILLGSEGVPRYLRFFMTDDNRELWIIYLCLLTVGMFLLHLLADKALERLGDHGGERIRYQSDKATLFHGEADFASQLFRRVGESWSTVLMVLGGGLLGLWLEWRLVLVLGLVLLAEALWLAWHWNRHLAPELDEVRQQFVDQRIRILQNLSGINTFVAFGVLVLLFLTDPAMNFLVGLVMFILTRHLLQRLVKGIQDGYFFAQHRERIEALAYPGRQVREPRQASAVSFEALLMPSRRHKLFDAIAEHERAGDPMAGRDWRWQDCAGRGQALYVSHPERPGQPELRLKVFSSAKDAGLAREVLFHESPSGEALGLSPKMLASGDVFGRGYILLASSTLTPIAPGDFPEQLKKVRFRLWEYKVDDALARRLARSYASLDQRLDAERFQRLRLGCNTVAEEATLDAFLAALDDLRQRLACLPKVLVNRSLNTKNLMITDVGEPLVMDWDAIALDLIGVGLSIADLDKAYAPEAVLATRAPIDGAAACLDSDALRLATHLTELEALLAREAYAAALGALPAILELSAAGQAVSGAEVKAVEGPVPRQVAS